MPLCILPGLQIFMTKIWPCLLQQKNLLTLSLWERSFHQLVAMQMCHNALARPVRDSATAAEANIIRPVKIEHFLQHSCTVDSDTFSQVFAVCKWPEEHPDKMAMGKQVEVWCRNSF